MEPIHVVISTVAVICAYQVWVSIQLLRSSMYEPSQKWFQLALIWLVPMVGAVVVQSMMQPMESQDTSRRRAIPSLATAHRE